MIKRTVLDLVANFIWWKRLPLPEAYHLDLGDMLLPSLIITVVNPLQLEFRTLTFSWVGRKDLTHADLFVIKVFSLFLAVWQRLLFNALISVTRLEGSSCLPVDSSAITLSNLPLREITTSLALHIRPEITGASSG